MSDVADTRHSWQRAAALLLYLAGLQVHLAVLLVLELVLAAVDELEVLDRRNGRSSVEVEAECLNARLEDWLFGRVSILLPRVHSKIDRAQTQRPSVPSAMVPRPQY